MERTLATAVALLIALAACTATPLPADREREVVQAVGTAVAAPPRLGVFALAPAANAPARQLRRALAAAFPAATVVAFPDGEAVLPALGAFVDGLPSYDAVVIVGPDAGETWPCLTPELEKAVRREGGEVEERLYHFREEFIHWRSFYQPVRDMLARGQITAVVYRSDFSELERLRDMQTGRAPLYYGAMLQAYANRTPLPDAAAALRPLLALPPQARSARTIDVWEEKEESGEGFTRHRLFFADPLLGRIEALLLLPDTPSRAPAPAVLGLHGHSDETGDFLRRFQGEALARRGFVVLAPSFAASGKGEFNETEAACLAIAAGSSLMALRVEQARTMLDYLATRAEVDAARLGLWGHSMGGALALFVGAADARVKVTATDQSNVLLDELTRDNPAVSLYLPGLLQLGDWERLAELIRPRAVWRSPYGFPEKEKLTRFLTDELSAVSACGDDACRSGETAAVCPADCPADEERPVRFRMLTAPAKQAPLTPREALLRLYHDTPAAKADLLDLTYLSTLAEPLTVTRSGNEITCRAGRLGQAHITFSPPADAAAGWVVMYDADPTDPQPDRIPPAPAAGSGLIAFRFPDMEKTAEDPLKLLTAGANQTALQAALMHACLHALQSNQTLPAGPYPLQAESHAATAAALIAAAVEELGPVLSGAPSSVVERCLAVPNAAGLRNSGTEKVK